MWSTQNSLFSGDPGLCCRFEAKSSQFFASFDSLIVLTLRSAAYILCSGDFRTDDDDAGRQTYMYKTITLPLAHARGVINTADVLGKNHVILTHVHSFTNLLTSLVPRPHPAFSV